MPDYGVQKSSINSVLSWYNDQEGAGWHIYTGRSPKPDQFHAGYSGNDKQEGADRLAELLHKIEPGDFGTYFLKICPASKSKTAIGPGTTFQLNQRTYVTPQQSGMSEVLAELKALRMQKEIELDEEDDEEDDQPENSVTNNPFLAGILNNPNVQLMINNFLTSIAANFVSVPKTNVAVSGIETDDLNTIIQTLFSKGVTNEDLAKLAAMDQKQINFLLSMLRK